MTVNFATAGRCVKASDNVDAPTSGTATFAPGVTTKTVTVVADKTKESDEWFSINLTDSSTNPFILDNPVIGTIHDDAHGRR